MKQLTDLSIRRLKDECPSFQEAVQHARTDKERGAIDAILMQIDAFDGDPYLLYLALWYAYERGVAITLVPKSE